MQNGKSSCENVFSLNLTVYLSVQCATIIKWKKNSFFLHKVYLKFKIERKRVNKSVEKEMRREKETKKIYSNIPMLLCWAANHPPALSANGKSKIEIKDCTIFERTRAKTDKSLKPLSLSLKMFCYVHEVANEKEAWFEKGKRKNFFFLFSFASCRGTLHFFHRNN